MANKKYIFGLLAISLFLRILFLVLFRDVLPQDTDGYDRWSHYIFSKEGLFDESLFRRAPGYSVFLGVLHLVFGHSILAIQISQTVLGTLTVFLVYCISNEILYSFWPKVCGVFAACSINLIHLSHGILSENVYIPLLLLGLLFALKYKPVKSGSLLALASLVRPQGLIAVMSTYYFLMKQAYIKHILYFVLGFIAVIAPWVIRNQMVYDKLVLVNLQAGDVFWGSNNRLAKGRWINLNYFKDPDIPKVVKLTPPEANSFMWNKGIDYLQTIGVSGTLKLIAMRYLYFLFPAGRTGEVRWVDLTFILLLPFAVFGFLYSNTYPYFLLRVFTVFFILQILLFAQFGVRYRAPLEPVLIIFAVSALKVFWTRLKRSSFWIMNAMWSGAVLLLGLTPAPRLIWQYSKEFLSISPI